MSPKGIFMQIDKAHHLEAVMGSSTGGTTGVPGADPAGVTGAAPAALDFALALAVAFGTGADGNPNAVGSIVPCRSPPILMM